MNEAYVLQDITNQIYKQLNTRKIRTFFFFFLLKKKKHTIWSNKLQSYIIYTYILKFSVFPSPYYADLNDLFLFKEPFKYLRKRKIFYLIAIEN